MQVGPEQDNGHAGTPKEPVATEARADAPEVPPVPPDPDPAMEQEPEPTPGESLSQTLARSLAADPQVVRNQRMDCMYKPFRSVRNRSRFDPEGNLLATPKRGPHQEHEGSEDVLWVSGDFDADDELVQSYLDDWGHCFPMSPDDYKVELVCLSQQQIAKRKEVNFRRLTSTQRRRYELAMQKEWDNINQPHVTKVLSLGNPGKSALIPPFVDEL